MVRFIDSDNNDIYVNPKAIKCMYQSKISNYWAIEFVDGSSIMCKDSFEIKNFLVSGK